MAKKALISTIENNRICQIENDNDIFPVSESLEWVICPDDCNTQWTYENEQFIQPKPYIPTVEDNKKTAVNLLTQTDWTTIPDVADPVLSNPYLTNQAEFITYRNQVRPIAINPVAGNLTWPSVPVATWSN
jgi:hypothetical protein